MAKMGLAVRDDPKKVVDIAGRTWGEPVNGLALSVLLKTKEDPDELPAISVAIHNQAPEAKRLTIRGWLSFLRVSLVGPDGVAAGLTSYGFESMKTERLPAPSDVVLTPGEATEADIPIGSIYEMRRGPYHVQVTCESPGGGLITSNEIRVDL
jgi:hypothetical protein